MSKKHYIAIAKAFAEVKEHIDSRYESPDYVYYVLRTKVADVLSDDNPQFDRAKFEKACEPL